jgi:hypothetical protein
MIHNVQQQQMLKMPPPTFLKMRYHPNHRAFFFDIFEDFLASAPNSPFSVMFQVLQASCFNTVDPSLKKYPQKDVGWDEVWRSWWPKSTPNNAITEEVQQ